MSARRVLSVAGTMAVALVGLALLTPPSYAAVTDLYVAQGGNDANDCTSQLNPCATLQRAVDVATAPVTTIHVGAGSFAGLVTPTAEVVVQGAGAGQTFVTASAGSTAVFDLSTVSTLDDLTVQATSTIGVRLTGPAQVNLNGVVLDGGTCGLYVYSGTASLTDSVVQNPDAETDPTCGFPGQPPSTMNGEIALYASSSSSSVSLVRTQVIDPADGQAAVDVKGGTFTADESYLHNRDVSPSTSGSRGVSARGGFSRVTRTTIQGFKTGVDASGGFATLGDTTLQGNSIGVNASNGSATLIRSTVAGNGTGAQAGAGGTVDAAGSLFGPSSGAGSSCNQAITDEGYNLNSDGTCGFSGTSKDHAKGLGLDTVLGDHGGPSPVVPTLAIRSAGSAVDAIPAGATSNDDRTPLCPATGVTDERGVPRPAAGACDAGAFELPATTTTAKIPATAKPGASMRLSAQVVLPDVGVSGLVNPSGSVDFKAGSAVLCDAVLTSGGHASCATGHLSAGARKVTAAYVPDSAARTLHGSRSTAHQLLVGTTPGIKGPAKVTVKVGRRASVTWTATGQPTPTFAISGKLPAGMKATRRAGRLTMSGAPEKSAAGTHSVKVKATNPVGSATKTLKIVVKR